MVIYNIQANGASNQLVIELINDSVLVEPNSVVYITGDIKLNASPDTPYSRFKASFIGSSYYKPTYSGTGKIYLKATLGTYHKFVLKDDNELILGPNTFVACRNNLELTPTIKISLQQFLTGAPSVETKIKGNGNVMILMPGPVMEYVLNSDKFVAYSNDIAAYSPTLQVTREFAGKGWLNIANKRVQVFRGTGSVFFSPHPNKGTRR
jgi:uncharacterized protein (AIM24 family)